MKTKYRFNFLLIPLLLASCGNDTPSTSEIKNLIINEGVESGKEQIKRIMYDYLANIAVYRKNKFRENHVTEDEYGGMHGFQSIAIFDQNKSKIDSIEINSKNLKKIVERFIDIKSSFCSPKKGFDKFYDCSVNLIQSNGSRSVLRTINVSFHRMNDGSLSELSDTGMNIFTSLTLQTGAGYFIEISPERRTINPNNDSEFLVKNKKIYFDLMNYIKSVELN